MSLPNIISDVTSDPHQDAILVAQEVVKRYELSDLEPLLQAALAQSTKHQLNVAVFGRFKAGKSSFLNQLVGKDVLPIGVLPVTSVITEISYGREERAEIISRDGKSKHVAINEIGSFITESENPHNIKEVEVVRVSLPSLNRMRGITLVDTPGLESVFGHNTEATHVWSPNVDLALVAVGVDPPLSHQDVELIKRLFAFTPNVSVLLTKVDILDDTGRTEVVDFVRSRLKEQFATDVAVFPYSTRPSFESLRKEFEERYIHNALESFHSHRFAILNRKLQTLLNSAEDYLHLASKASEALESQRDEIRSRILGGDQSLSDQKLQLQLLAKHTAGRTRSAIENHLENNIRKPLTKALIDDLSALLGTWRGSFAYLLSHFEDWLRISLRQKLEIVSSSEQKSFIEPMDKLRQQYQHNLQMFRDQLSDKVMQVFGVPLRTSETDIEVQPPRSPDVSVGKIFDHDWQLLSWLIPMSLFRQPVEKRFFAKVEYEVYKNLSRLTYQWEENIKAAINKTQKEVERRLDDLVRTVHRLLAATEDNENGALIEEYRLRIRRIANTLEGAAFKQFGRTQ